MRDADHWQRDGGWSKEGLEGRGCEPWLLSAGSPKVVWSMDMLRPLCWSGVVAVLAVWIPRQ